MLPLIMQLSLYAPIVVVVAAAVVAIVCLALQVLSMQLLPQHHPALPPSLMIHMIHSILTFNCLVGRFAY